MKRILSVLIIGIVGLGLSGAIDAIAQEKKEEKPLYLQVIEKLENLKPRQTIDVAIGTEKAEYSLDEYVEIRFQANKECYAVLMDIGAAQKDLQTNEILYGDITFLVPSAQVLDNKIEGERVYSTVNDFKMNIKTAKPAGYETINFFCMPAKFDLFDPALISGGGYTIKPNETEKLTQLLERLNQLEQVEWSGSSVSFLIQDPELLVKNSTGEGNTRDIKKYGAIPPIGSTGSAGASGKLFPPIGSTGSAGATK